MGTWDSRRKENRSNGDFTEMINEQCVTMHFQSRHKSCFLAEKQVKEQGGSIRFFIKKRNKQNLFRFFVRGYIR